MQHLVVVLNNLQHKLIGMLNNPLELCNIQNVNGGMIFLNSIKVVKAKYDTFKAICSVDFSLVTFSCILVPDVNIATPSHGAQIIEGELKQALLNGDTLNYDMERGFTRHPIEDGSEGIVVNLGSPFIINHIKLLLWDRDQRYLDIFSYFLSNDFQ